jgi:3-isopropylmalate dehydrogenase
MPRETRPEAGLLGLRKRLDLFANIRPIRVFDALVDASPLKPEVVRGVDLMIVRELTGGLYFGKPSKRWSDSRGRRAVDTLAYREQEISRLVQLGFELAAARRKKVTSVDKANVLSSSQLWRAVATEIAAKHPEITTEHALVDSTAMTLITHPRDFDVMVMENTFGDILSDEAAVLAGSLGMLPSASLNGKRPKRRGTKALQFGMYEPIHGTAPDIAGKGIANPSGAILSAAMLLRTSLGQSAAADAIEAAVDATLQSGARTRDIAAGGASISTAEFGAEVRRRLANT